MAYAKFEVEIEGLAPLLMHNAQLADPLNSFVRRIKQITAKRTSKTEADLEELQKLEFMGGLYLDEKSRPAVPGENIEGMIRDGAKKSRKGSSATCGVFCEGIWPLNYKGPTDPEKLFQDARFRDYRGCGIKDSRVMRMRPKFSEWSLAFELNVDDEIASRADLEKWLRDAGLFVGLGDFRPRHGRFKVNAIK